MTPERARRLEDVGFQWSTKDPRHVPWEQRFSELEGFVKRFGHAQVPIGWNENVKLSNWVSCASHSRFSFEPVLSLVLDFR